jgi:hypothetical protein
MFVQLHQRLWHSRKHITTRQWDARQKERVEIRTWQAPFHTLIQPPLNIPVVHTRASCTFRPAACGWFTQVFHTLFHTPISYIVSRACFVPCFIPPARGHLRDRVFDTHGYAQAQLRTRPACNNYVIPSTDTFRPQKHATPENNMALERVAATNYENDSSTANRYNYI